jgi:hypothetical protein
MSRFEGLSISKQFNKNEFSNRERRLQQENSKKYNIAEKWFQDRKNIQMKNTIKLSKAPPGLSKAPPGSLNYTNYTNYINNKKTIKEDCPLDFTIPLYDDFNYIEPY